MGWRRWVVVALVAAAPLQAGPSEDEREIAERLLASYVPVVAVVPEGYSGDYIGAGFCVDDYAVLTVAHNQPSPDIGVSVGYPHDARPATVIGRDSRLDMMLLETDRKCQAVLQVAWFSALSQRVVAVGTPFGSYGVLSWGRVARRNGGEETLLVDIDVMAGFSGSPIVALDGPEAGRVVGILTKMYGGNRGDFFAIADNATAIRAFLRRHGIDAN